MAELSLTQQEAVDRAALIEVTRYDIDVDLRGLLDGERWASTSTVAFTCGEPGASTFVDCTATILEATLNGVALDPATVIDGRLHLHDLRADNVLRVSCEQTDTASAAGILRTVDPLDGLVYVWTSFEADDARRAWACFDQPDLKAPHGFTVIAPSSWTVTSNNAPDLVEDQPDDARRWTFPDTPPLSTYVVVVNAGPFVEVREERGGHSLGLFARQSLRANLERDAPELLDLTEAGLAFFGEQFARKFPQHRYDQVFVPNMGGAMENWGCVTWSDGFLHRGEPTRSQRSLVASILLHEMAHMWFGDLVTMRWWDDLWLNEAFASWAALWAQVRVTEYVDADAAEVLGSTRVAYATDMGPATHAIRVVVPDVAQAMANFDAITYEKGCAVLGQLVAHVGEDAFVAGLRAYFRDHAWGNTRLADLMDAVGTAAGTDLGGWTAAWFDRSGTDTLTLVPAPGGGPAVLLASAPEGEPRPHTLEIGSYTDPGDGGPLRRIGGTRVATTGAITRVPDLPRADLHLVDDRAMTYAAVRTEGAAPMLLAVAGRLPDATARAVALNAAWDQLVKGEVEPPAVLDCFLDALSRERTPDLVDTMLRLTRSIASWWTPAQQVASQQARVAAVAATLVEIPDVRRPALRALAATAATPELLDLVATAAADDIDLQWRLLGQRAALGDHDEAAVAALVEADPDPDAAVRAGVVRAARPTEQAKAEAWQLVAVERSVPSGPLLREMADAFWRPEQAELARPWCDAYLDLVTGLPPGAMLSVLGLIGSMFPDIGDSAFLDRARTAAADPRTTPTVRSELLTGTDRLERRLRGRGELG
jgi:aminopeptidase N